MALRAIFRAHIGFIFGAEKILLNCHPTQTSEMELHYEKCVRTGIFRHDESGMTFDSSEELVAHLRREGVVPGEQSVHCPSCLGHFPAPDVGPHYETCVEGVDSDYSLPCLRCSNRSESWKISDFPKDPRSFQLILIFSVLFFHHGTLKKSS